MPRFDVVVDCAIDQSFRVKQVAGMFDLSIADRAEERFEVELPDDDEWRIGLIVGPSGSGKSTVAREYFGETPQHKWSDKSVLDNFDADIKAITETFTAVGFSSPPAWVKPYSVLSTGQKFRCDLAHAILHGGDRIVIDEFTSTVDRTVAQIGSAAVSKAIKVRGCVRQMVAVSCHYDIAEWLEPDWVLDMQNCQLARGCLRRPEINVQLYRAPTSAWKAFARHHYLTESLPVGSQCYVLYADGKLAGFSAVCGVMGWAGRYRVARVVVLPDFQGVGLGRILLNESARLYPNCSATTSHPAMRRAIAASPEWVHTGTHKFGQRHGTRRKGTQLRPVSHFRFVGERACQAPQPAGKAGNPTARRRSTLPVALRKTRSSSTKKSRSRKRASGRAQNT